MILIMLLFSLSVFAQLTEDFKYQIVGSFQPNNTTIPHPVHFSLKWNEDSNIIQGIYSDNIYATTDAVLTGKIRPDGRNFKVELPDITNGVKSIDIQSQKADEGPISSTFTFKSSDGATTEVYNLGATASVDVITNIEDPQVSCVVGMGALTEYCGTYRGSINEESDSSIRCETALLSSNLELTTGGDFKLNLEPNGLIPAPDSRLITNSHLIGGLNGAGPLTATVNVSNRYCGELIGTNFPVENCKNLNLVGTFSNFAGIRGFAGTYTIRDVLTDEFCSFRLNFELQ